MRISASVRMAAFAVMSVGAFVSASIGAGMPPAAAQEIHELQSSETVYQISRRYGIPIDVLLQSNNIDDPTTLPVGKKILIPDVSGKSGGVAQTKTGVKTGADESIQYEVEKGDTLYSIARKFETTVSMLKERNKLSDADAIRAGAMLLIPAVVSADASASKPAPSIVPASERGVVVSYADKPVLGLAPDAAGAVAELDGGLDNDLGDGQAVADGQNVAVNRVPVQDPARGAAPVLQARASFESVKPQQPVQKTAQSQIKSPTKNAAENAPAASSYQTASASFASGDTESLLERAVPLSITSKEFPVRGKPYILKKDSGVYIESAENSLVKAVSSGKVLYVASYGTFLNVVVIQADSGETFVYAGQESVLVRQGEAVRKGQGIGTVGIMPLVKRPVLYFAVLKEDQFINPEKFII